MLSLLFAVVVFPVVVALLGLALFCGVEEFIDWLRGGR